MMRTIVYGLIGLVIGAIAGVAIVGTYTPNSGMLGFTILGVVAIIFATMGGVFGRWMHNRDKGLQAQLTAPKSVYQVGGAIGLIIWAFYVPLAFACIVLFSNLSTMTLTHFAQDSFSPFSIGISVVCYVLFGAFVAWVAVRYVANHHILNSSQSSKEIVRWTFTANFTGVFMVWQSILAACTQNPSVFLVGLGVGLVAMYATQYFVGYFIRKEQKIL